MMLMSLLLYMILPSWGGDELVIGDDPQPQAQVGRLSTGGAGPGGACRVACPAMFAATRILLPRPAFDVETEAPCGTSVGEAREALAFWRARLKRLPWYRRAARAEARDMVGRWQRRMVQAELERWQLRGLVRPVLTVIDWWMPTPRRRITTRVLRASRLARMVAVAAAVGTVTGLALFALAVVAVAQLV
jgi:hypothetical protein